MNQLEKKLVNLLKDLAENHGVVGIKTEFEAEGARLDEIFRLRDLGARANLGLTLKIGGCEAMRDLHDARVIGAARVVAPMIETPFALTKFIGAIDAAIPADEQADIEFCINIETISAVENFTKMLLTPKLEKIAGVVIGRVDLTQSMGLGSKDIDSQQVLNIAQSIFKTSKKHNLATTIGGGNFSSSVPLLQTLLPNLDRFEGRKVIFDAAKALANKPDLGILKSVQFELLWLKNKQAYYDSISQEDAPRIAMLEKRYAELAAVLL